MQDLTELPAFVESPTLSRDEQLLLPHEPHDITDGGIGFWTAGRSVKQEHYTEGGDGRVQADSAWQSGTGLGRGRDWDTRVWLRRPLLTDHLAQRALSDPRIRSDFRNAGIHLERVESLGLSDTNQ